MAQEFLQLDMDRRKAVVIMACLNTIQRRTGREDIGEVLQWFEGVVEASIKLDTPVPIMIDGREQ